MRFITILLIIFAISVPDMRGQIVNITPEGETGTVNSDSIRQAFDSGPFFGDRKSVV